MPRTARAELGELPRDAELGKRPGHLGSERWSAGLPPRGDAELGNVPPGPPSCKSAAEVQRAVDALDLDDAAQTYLFCPYECEACEAADFAASPPAMYAAICEPLLCAGDDDGGGGGDECSPKASAARRLFKAAEPARAPRLSCWRRLQLFCCPPRNGEDDAADPADSPDRDAPPVAF